MAVIEPKVWVVANFKETQLTASPPGQPVAVELDTYPGVKLPAHVDSIQRGSGSRFSLLPPENATGNYVKVVQRVPVKIVFDDLGQVQQYGLGPRGGAGCERPSTGQAVIGARGPRTVDDGHFQG